MLSANKNKGRPFTKEKIARMAFVNGLGVVAEQSEHKERKGIDKHSCTKTLLVCQKFTF